NDETRIFFNMSKYEKWRKLNNNGEGWEIIYYKGLGSHTSDEALGYFKNVDRYLRKFKILEDEDHELLKIVFQEENVNSHHAWINSNDNINDDNDGEKDDDDGEKDDNDGEKDDDYGEKDDDYDDFDDYGEDDDG